MCMVEVHAYLEMREKVSFDSRVLEDDEDFERRDPADGEDDEVDRVDSPTFELTGTAMEG